MSCIHFIAVINNMIISMKLYFNLIYVFWLVVSDNLMSCMVGSGNPKDWLIQEIDCNIIISDNDSGTCHSFCQWSVEGSPLWGLLCEAPCVRPPLWSSDFFRQISRVENYKQFRDLSVLQRRNGKREWKKFREWKNPVAWHQQGRTEQHISGRIEPELLWQER